MSSDTRSAERMPEPETAQASGVIVRRLYGWSIPSPSAEEFGQAQTRLGRLINQADPKEWEMLEGVVADIRNGK